MFDWLESYKTYKTALPNDHSSGFTLLLDSSLNKQQPLVLKHCTSHIPTHKNTLSHLQIQASVLYINTFFHFKKKHTAAYQNMSNMRNVISKKSEKRNTVSEFFVYKSDRRSRGSDGGLWLNLQHKLVWFWVDIFLADSELRDSLAVDHQAEVAVFELELCAMTQQASDWCLADQSPLQSTPALTVVLQSGTRSQVALQKWLLTKQHKKRALSTNQKLHAAENKHNLIEIGYFVSNSLIPSPSESNNFNDFFFYPFHFFFLFFVSPLWYYLTAKIEPHTV